MNSNQFRQTRNLYINYLQYDKQLSYVEWVSLPDDSKAAALFVNFFDQIELAWYKSKSLFTSEEDGVYTVMQYLMKNVEIIKNDPKRYTPNYIYRVAYNCLYCICHDPIIERIRYENTTSNIVKTSDNEVDLFDTTVSIYSEVEIQFEKKQLVDIIRSLSLKEKKVIAHLVEGAPLTKYSSRSPWANDTDIRDVEVSKDEMIEIKNRLANVLKDFEDLL